MVHRKDIGFFTLRLCQGKYLQKIHHKSTSKWRKNCSIFGHWSFDKILILHRNRIMLSLLGRDFFLQFSLALLFNPNCHSRILGKLKVLLNVLCWLESLYCTLIYVAEIIPDSRYLYGTNSNTHHAYNSVFTQYSKLLLLITNYF